METTAEEKDSKMTLSKVTEKEKWGHRRVSPKVTRNPSKSSFRSLKFVKAGCSKKKLREEGMSHQAIWK